MTDKKCTHCHKRLPASSWEKHTECLRCRCLANEVRARPELYRRIWQAVTNTELKS